jgi:hypothetical protein
MIMEFSVVDEESLNVSTPAISGSFWFAFSNLSVDISLLYDDSFAASAALLRATRIRNQLKAIPMIGAF